MEKNQLTYGSFKLSSALACAKYSTDMVQYFRDTLVKFQLWKCTQPPKAFLPSNWMIYPYVTPNYDSYFFEVATGKGVKMLHELKRGEWGRLIISSCMLPRYDIGDLVEAAGKNYYRIIGRKNALTLLEHRLYRMFLGWLI